MNISRIFIFAIICLSLGSCGLPLHRDLVVKNKGEVRQFEVSNPVFANIVTQFEQAGKQYSGNSEFTVGDVPVNFGDTENPSFEGVCFSYPDGRTEVIIRESWWNSASQALRESLLFHELGHCVLGRDHDNETVEVNGASRKSSMMNAVIVNSNQYSQFRAGYLTELFTQTKQTLYTAFGI
ncbi:MAG: hypothetical protein CME70_22215 [Halobacteriovorax sp.]|nr:hypothetical protein [Halobacteriovorax sp.]